MKDTVSFTYHDICMWLPHKPDTIADIAKDMTNNGFREDRPIVLYEGAILDGRHRYEAAIDAGVDPIYVEYEGTREDAINYVTSENVNRRHLKNEEKEYFYIKLAGEVGVRQVGAPDGNRNRLGVTSNTSNEWFVPTQVEHADALGVDKSTVSRWEADRKEMVKDPELSKKMTTPEGFKEAKKEVQQRRKATKEEATRIAKLKNLADSSEAESSNVNTKLDKYRDLGVDVDSVESQGEEDSARQEYRATQKPLEDMAREIAKTLVNNKDYNFVAALARGAYPKQGELEHAYNIITADDNNSNK